MGGVEGGVGLLGISVAEKFAQRGAVVTCCLLETLGPSKCF